VAGHAAAPPGEQLYLRAGDRPLFAVFHPASGVTPGGQAPRAVVLLVGAWGAEDMSAHRGWRELAENLASAGCPALRLDLDGCGDSQDLPADADHWSAWQTSVNDAVRALQTFTGVQHVTLVGLRSGALLAATVAAQCEDIKHLVMVAPVRSGKAYLRELRMLSGAMEQGGAGQDGGLLAAGFELNASTVAALGQATLPASVRAKVVTVVDRDDLGIGQGWLNALALSGVVTEYSAHPGFKDMVLTAHKAIPARAMWDAVVTAVVRPAPASSELPLSRSLARAAVDRRALTTAAMSCGGPDQGQVKRATVTEFVLDPHGPMAVTGIVVMPAEGAPRTGRGLLILNSSAERRIGPNRMWVTFARERAACGDVVVRLDMPGLGESGSEDAPGGNTVYPQAAVARLQSTVAHLRAQPWAAHWAVMGLCSGGYHSFRLGVADAAIERVFALNTFGLLPEEVADFDARAAASLQHAVAHQVVSRLGDGRRWLKLLQGRVNVTLVLGALWSRAGQRLASAGARLGLLFGWLPDLPLTQALRALADRSCRVHFIFSTTDPGPTILRESTGNAIVSMMLSGTVTEDLVDNADHVFSGLAGRAQMMAHLHRRLDQWQISAPTSPTRQD